MYDPRIDMLWAMGISDSAGSLLSTERYLSVAHAGSAMWVAGDGDRRCRFMSSIIRSRSVRDGVAGAMLVIVRLLC